MGSDNKTPATLESVWEAFRETERLMKESSAEFDERMKESRAEFDERMKESRAEFDKQTAEFDKRMKESRAEFDKRTAEYEKRMKVSDEKYDRRMKNLEDRYGSHSQNLGSFAEEYFFNSFENGERHFFGEKFDHIKRNLATGLNEKIEDEYDIVLLNGKSVAIIEVKFKGHTSDIQKVVKKAKTFRINYPKYVNHRIFLGLASMSFYPELEKKCIHEGIAIVKQVGDTVVIHDENLKTF